MQKKLVLFDLDGVLIDSRENMRKSWLHVTKNSNIKIPFEEYFSRIGRPFADIMKDLGIFNHVEELEYLYKNASFSFLNEVNFFSGVEETLKELHLSGVKLGIVTSKDKLRTNTVLKKIEIPFITIQTPGKQFRGKPAPDYLLMAMAEANEDPSDTLFVGDMPTDCEAAKRAGVDYVHAAWGYGNQIEFIGSINTISDLIGYLQ